MEVQEKTVAGTLITEFQVYFTQPSRKKTRIANRQKTDSTVRESPEPGPSLMQNLNKTEEFNPFSEKSKELLTSMGNTENFELCESSSKIQCPDCALYWETGVMYCTCGKCMQPTQRNRQLNRARYEVLINLRLPVFQKKKESHPRSQTWTIYAAVHVLQST